MKCREKIKKTNICKNNLVLLGLTFLAFLLLLIALNPRILKVPYIFGEDGWVFAKEYMQYGIGSFGLTYGGYFDTLSRIFSMIAVNVGRLTNSAIALANTIKWLSLFFSAFVATYFTSSSFEGIIKSRWKRIIVSALSILLISNFAWLLYNGVAIHWWCGLFLFLVSLNLLQGKMPSYHVLPLLLISIISSASSLILGFAIVYYIIKNSCNLEAKGSECFREFWKKLDCKHPLKIFTKIGKHNSIKLILMLIFLIIQAYSILFMSDVETITNVNLSFRHLISVSYYAVLLLISSVNLLFGTDIFLALGTANLNIFIGSILWLFIIYIATKTKTLKYCFLAMLDIFFLYFMINFKRANFMDYYQQITSGVSYQVWYHALPAVFILFVVMLAFYHKKSTLLSYKAVEISLLCFLCLFFVRNINHPEFETSREIEKIEPYVDFNNHRYTLVQVSPDFQKVYMEIPVSDSYCKTHKCTNEIRKYRLEGVK